MPLVLYSLVSQEHMNQFELWSDFNVDLLILKANLTIYITKLRWLCVCVIKIPAALKHRDFFQFRE